MLRCSDGNNPTDEGKKMNAGITQLLIEHQGRMCRLTAQPDGSVELAKWSDNVGLWLPYRTMTVAEAAKLLSESPRQWTPRVSGGAEAVARIVG